MTQQRLIPLLTLLLLAQLAAGLWLWSADRVTLPARGALLSFDHDAVDTVEIRDGDGHDLRLVKTAAGWQLPGDADFPAAGFLVNGLLDRLATLHPGLAVATSDDAAGRFHVADDKYERRIRLLAGDKVLAELYLGDAAGPRRSYARVAGDSTVYPLAFSGFDARAEADAWTDKAYLHRDTDALQSVQLGDLRLVRDGKAWRLADLAADEHMDAKAADQLVQRLARLNFMGVHGRADKVPGGKMLLTATLTLAGDKAAGDADGKPVAGGSDAGRADAAPRTVEYRFYDPGKDGDPLLWVSDRDHVVRVASFDFKPLAEMTRDKLLQTPQARADETAPAVTPTDSTPAPAPGQP